jgi:hypothetical protein
MDRKTLINKARAPWGLHEAIDNKIDEYVNQPLAKAGHPDMGAGISAGLSAANKLFIPNSVEDAALAAVPYGKLGKLRGLAKEGKALNYGAMAAEDAAKAAAKRAEAEASADMLYYVNDGGEIVRLKPKEQQALGLGKQTEPVKFDPWSNELEAAERLKQGK